MKILKGSLEESMICVLPDEQTIEVSMLCADGEEVAAVPSVVLAVVVIQRYLSLKSSQSTKSLG